MIKYYDMSAITNRVSDATRKDIDDIMNQNNFIYDTKDFEDRFKRFTDVKYCVGVSSGTAALHLALGAIGIEPGDEVIVSPWTMCASATAILHWFAIPVFADIEDDTFNLDINSVEKNINTR